jgi:hypothetical protein
MGGERPPGSTPASRRQDFVKVLQHLGGVWPRRGACVVDERLRKSDAIPSNEVRRIFAPDPLTIAHERWSSCDVDAGLEGVSRRSHDVEDRNATLEGGKGDANDFRRERRSGVEDARPCRYFLVLQLAEEADRLDHTNIPRLDGGDLSDSPNDRYGPIVPVGGAPGSGRWTSLPASGAAQRRVGVVRRHWPQPSRLVLAVISGKESRRIKPREQH